MSKEDKTRGVPAEHHHLHHHHQEPQPYPTQYGTFQGVANYPPPPPPPQSQPVVGFPQPAPPPGATAHYVHGYQAVPVYVVAEGRPVRERRLPCCGCGIGWVLFIIGFFLAAVPWYVGVVIMLVSRIDHREKPGYIACTIAAILATVAIIFGLVDIDDW
ncbi:60S ribosomal protein L18a-like protein [Quillaja saponaria]|uniref:60S ribosomal protein L18a-like protein n=1 Tax=Quillaja saponaria TaxID=32244 RepID=A0AAD7QI52_QUISA|nr:60S ribosomal protein L18a-like protein [Quillaja saponaria]